MIQCAAYFLIDCLTNCFLATKKVLPFQFHSFCLLCNLLHRKFYFSLPYFSVFHHLYNLFVFSPFQTISYMAERVVGHGSFGVVFQVRFVAV